MLNEYKIIYFSWSLVLIFNIFFTCILLFLGKCWQIFKNSREVGLNLQKPQRNRRLFASNVLL